MGWMWWMPELFSKNQSQQLDEQGKKINSLQK